MSTPVQSQLEELARLLRQTRHLDPAAQRAVADLVEELARTIHPETMPTHETTHLAETTAELARALHEQEDVDVLSAAKDRVEAAALRAEAKAPGAADIVHRLIDALANLGI